MNNGFSEEDGTLKRQKTARGKRFTAFVAALATTAGVAFVGGAVPEAAQAAPPDPVAVTATPNTAVDPGTNVAVNTTVTNTTGVDSAATAWMDVPTGTNFSAATASPGWSLEYSTDGGGSWSAVAPGDPSTVTNVRASTASIPASASSGQLADMSSTGAVTVSGAGDGYNATFYKGRLWLANHHARAGDPTYGTWLKCFDKYTGAVCPDVGSGTGATFISDVAGTAFGAGTGTYDTPNVSESFIDQSNGHIYVPAQENAVSGLTKVGWLCGDLDTLTSCGFVQAGTEEAPQDWGGKRLFTRFNPMPVNSQNSTQLLAVGGSGKVYCFDAASNALCANSGTKSVATPVVMPDYQHMPFAAAASANRGDATPEYAFITNATTTHNAVLECSHLTGAACFTTITLDGAAAFPTATGVSWSQPVPVYTKAGALEGVCVGGNGGYTDPLWKCFTLAGDPLPAWETTFGAIAPTPKAHLSGRFTTDTTLGYSLAMTTINIGTKTYIPWVTYPTSDWNDSINSVGCFDFATGAACAGFTPPTDPYPSNILYTNAPDDINPNCLWWSGNEGHLIAYDAQTGVMGCGAIGRTTVAANPVSCTTVGGHYTTFSIPNLPAGTSALVRFYDDQGNLVTVGGQADHTIATAADTVDLSTIPVSGTTTKLSARVWVSAPAVVSMKGVSAVIGWDSTAPAICAIIIPTDECEAGATPQINVFADLTPVTGPAVSGKAQTSFTMNRNGQSCLVALTKKINGELYPAAPGYSTGTGAPLPYTFEVSTPGTYSLGTPDLTDNNTTGDPGDDFHPTYVSGDTNKNNRLDPGETWLYSYNGTAITGTHTNVATVTAPGATNNPQTAQAVYTAAVNSISIVKKTDGQRTGAELVPGDPVDWTYEVTNTGPQTVSSIVLTDSVEGAVTCPKTALAPAETMTCTKTGTVVPGPYSNTGTVAGKDPQNQTVTGNSTSDYVAPTPEVDIVKTINNEGNLDTQGSSRYSTGTGAPLTYRFSVTNTGDTPLKNVAVADTPVAPNSEIIQVTCPKTTLAAKEAMVCTGTGTATSGTFDDTGDVVGTPTKKDGTTPLTHKDGTPVAPVTDTSTAGYTAAVNSISIVKKTDGQRTGAELVPGDPVDWTYEVTNTGPQTVSSIVLTDSVEGAVTCPKTALAPAETMTCTKTGTVKKGTYANTGTVAGKDPQNQTVTAKSDSDYSGYLPSVDIVKTINDQGNLDMPGTTAYATTPGTTLTYRFLVTNTGNTMLTSVKVSDTPIAPNKETIQVTCPKTSLTIGESMVCTGTGTAATGTFDDTGDVVGTPSTVGGLPIMHKNGTPVAPVTDISYAGYVASSAPTPTPTQTGTPYVPPTPTPTPTLPTPAPTVPGGNPGNGTDGTGTNPYNQADYASTANPDGTTVSSGSLAQTGSSANILLLGLAGLALIGVGIGFATVKRRG